MIGGAPKLRLKMMSIPDICKKISDLNASNSDETDLTLKGYLESQDISITRSYPLTNIK